MPAAYTPVAPPLDDPTVFPSLPGVSFPPAKSPIWSTRLASAASGRERRGRVWSYPKWQFKIAYEVLRDTPTVSDLQRLYGFFNLNAGRFAAFSYFDPTDNLVTSQQFGTGDGVTTTFQLTRTVGAGSMTFVEPVKAILGTPQVSIGANNSPAFNIAALGQIVFPSAPPAGAALAWSGQFMFRVRFDQDQLDPAQMMTALWSLDGLTLVSDKR